MKSLSYLSATFLLAGSALLTGCSDEIQGPAAPGTEAGLITLSASIDQQQVSRVNDEGFVNGDRMGVYVVDYEGERPGSLLDNGNRADNVAHTFDEEAYRWNSAFDIYWKDNHTRIDVYGYYPFGSPDKVNDYSFTVKTDQSLTYDDGTMGDYEASDFLWGKVEGVEPTANLIRLPLAHRMACARVTLIEGEGFADGEWADLSRQVVVSNTIHSAKIDLSTGSLTPDGQVSSTSIIPARSGDDWRAIVVPQTVAGGTTLFNLSIGGMPYRFARNEDFTYVGGKMNNFGIRIDKKTPSGTYQLTLISESVTPWENDPVSHDATAREYVVINSTPGGLQQAIADAGKDAAELKNLKVTGEINATDFFFMRDSMTKLQAVNLKEVKIRATSHGYESYGDDEIPNSAFSGKTSLIYFTFPDKLKRIGNNSFDGCAGLTGSLTIPEGVVEVGEAAFYGCQSLKGTLSLPSTLIKICGQAFGRCGFISELIIPDKCEYIGNYAFSSSNNFYGSLRLPESLKYLGNNAFFSCSNLTGTLEIPQGVSKIEIATFCGCGFDGNLILHDGITEIAEQAFQRTHFRGVLVLPKNLTTIGNEAFEGNSFSGELKFHESLVNIGDGAFARCYNITGTLEFGPEVRSVGASAFSNCNSIEKIVLPDGLDAIGNRTFSNCFGVGSIVCKDPNPPYLGSGAFDGVAKDNFVLEVPETAVIQYQTTPGWNEFKRIAAHHELVCRPAVACALSTAHTDELLIDAEGDWVVESMPEWVSLSQTSGSKKTTVRLTIQACAKGAETREGDIVFRLKDKDYTHACHVSQYGYEYGEDEYITLQRATRGNRGGINIVILGDGYNAKNIADGTYLKDMKEQVERFFAIEPYTTYRDYFNVYTAIPLSTESGVGTVNTLRNNRFSTTYTGGAGLKCDNDEVFSYVMNAPTVTSGNLNQTLIIMVPNSKEYGGVTQLWDSGAAIAFCPMSDYDYPLDARGVIQHEAGGHGFGKLADEYIYHNAFIDACNCVCCGHVGSLQAMKNKGWADNLELTGKMNQVGWSKLILDPRYSDIVDIYEGGYFHSRGVFRSEQNSCMNNNIPYFSTISRMSIVRRIKQYAGETFDYEDFVANDKRTSGLSRAYESQRTVSSPDPGRSFAPVIHHDDPAKRLGRSRR